jgi:peptidoglycan biosynthesis protein MviN/MurJ (putative lipid II flippase)
MGVYGIALAVSISGILQLVCLFSFWNRYSQNPAGRRVYRAYVKLAILSAPMGLVLHAFKTAVLPDPASQSASASILVAAGVGSLFIVLMIGVGYGLKVREIKDPLERVVARLKGRAHGA